MLGIALIIGCVSSTDFAHAQAPPLYRATSVTDIYGNARPVQRERREFDIFQDPVQQLALRGYQALQRRANQRGGVTPFGLLGDTQARRRAAMSTLPIFQQTLGLLPYPLTQTSERVFRAYGGFSTRVGGLQRADVAEAFERRRSLIAATSLNAPVHRANLNTVSAAAVIAAIDRTPFVETVAPDPSETTSTLDEWLGRRVALSHERIRSEAWGWFQDAEYRRAARAFESAALLDPEDHASLVGELFSYVSLGAGHTAITTLKQLGRRLADPFALEIDITARFDRPERAGEIRVRMQPPAQDVDVSPELTALHAFVLWYLGDRDDALRIATGLARSHPMSEYASWPALMRGVMTAAAVPSESLD